MPSAFIKTARRYPAMPLAGQLVHQRSVHPGPLVLRTAPIKFPPPAPDRDRTVSRRSEPSSRTALMGEQPNPWNLLQLQDAMLSLIHISNYEKIMKHRIAEITERHNQMVQKPYRIEMSIGTVSYTHLDVYKRQDYSPSLFPSAFLFHLF